MFLDIVIIGGFGNRYLQGKYHGIPFDDVEMISIVNDSVLHVNTAIPSLPKHLYSLTGAQLPNGNLLVRGTNRGDRNGDEYLLFKDASNQWIKVGATERAYPGHSSVLIDGHFFTTGSNDSYWYEFSYHEEFNLEGSLKEKRNLPKSLYYHTATIFGHQKILICGGIDNYVSYGFLNHENKQIEFIDVKLKF